MKYIYCAFTIFLWCCSADGSALASPHAAASNPCADIQNGQFVCLDCGTLAYCLQEGGHWTTFIYETCDTRKSMYCDESKIGCVYQPQCSLPTGGSRFECQNPGTYPDPFDCRYYHICSDRNVDTRISCPTNSVYSAAHKGCVVRSGHESLCNEPQYKCDKVGKMGAWEGDANIYYICHVNGPLLYRCPTGYVFNGQTCVVATTTAAATTTTTRTTPTPTTSTTTTTTRTTTTTTTPAPCINNALEPHPTNCRAFYRCHGGQRFPEQCPQGTYYNSRKSMCEFGDC